MQTETAAEGHGANLKAMEAAVNYAAWLLRSIENFARTKGNLADMRALDFGAGIGTLSAPLASKFHALTALEVDEGFRRTLKAREPAVEVCAGIEALAGRNFDLVFTSNVLEHIEDDVQTLRDIRTTMRKGAGLFIYVPACQELFGKMDELVGHRRRYDKYELQAKVSMSGFKVATVRYCDVIGYLAAFVHARAAKTGDLSEWSVRTYDRVITPVAPFADLLAFRCRGKNLMLTAVAN